MTVDHCLRKEIAAWAKRFPDSPYREVVRLRRWRWNALSVARPGVVGRHTNDILCERLSPDILEELQSINRAKDAGGRPSKHHQHLKEDVGHPALAQYLHAVIGLMRASVSWDQFRFMRDRAFAKKGTPRHLLLGDDEF